jgi:hypothetical protein
VAARSAEVEPIACASSTKNHSPTAAIVNPQQENRIARRWRRERTIVRTARPDHQGETHEQQPSAH